MEEMPPLLRPVHGAKRVTAERGAFHARATCAICLAMHTLLRYAQPVYESARCNGKHFYTTMTTCVSLPPNPSILNPSTAQLLTLRPLQDLHRAIKSPQKHRPTEPDPKRARHEAGKERAQSFGPEDVRERREDTRVYAGGQGGGGGWGGRWGTGGGGSLRVESGRSGKRSIQSRSTPERELLPKTNARAKKKQQKQKQQNNKKQKKKKKANRNTVSLTRSSMILVLTTSKGVVSPAATAPAILPARPACQVGKYFVLLPSCEEREADRLGSLPKNSERDMSSLRCS